MTRRRKPAEHSNHERWLVSYADFITLLFAFFVVLYASSQADKGKMGQLGAAIEAAFQNMGVFQGQPAGNAASSGATRQSARQIPVILAPGASKQNEQAEGTESRAELRELQKTLEEALAPEIKRNEVALRIGPEGLVISLREVGFFDSGSAALRSQAQGAFARIADILRVTRCDLRIEGHTDNVPIHTSQFKSNWELSTARATEMIRQLIESYGFSPDRLSAAGFAEYHPAASNDNVNGRRLNRRIDVVVLGEPLASTLATVNARSANGQLRANPAKVPSP